MPNIRSTSLATPGSSSTAPAIGFAEVLTGARPAKHDSRATRLAVIRVKAKQKKSHENYHLVSRNRLPRGNDFCAGRISIAGRIDDANDRRESVGHSRGNARLETSGSHRSRRGKESRARNLADGSEEGSHNHDGHKTSCTNSGRCSKRKENECQGDGRKVGKLQFPATTFRQSRGSLSLISSAYLQKVSLSINPACWQTSKRTPTPTSWGKTKN